MLLKLLQMRSPSSLCLVMCWPTICSVGVSQVATRPSQGNVSSRVGWLLVSRGFSSRESTLFQPRARADLVLGTVEVVVDGVWSSSVPGHEDGSIAKESGTPTGIWKTKH